MAPTTPPLKIFVFGSTGKTGIEVVKQALKDQDYIVTALARNPARAKSLFTKAGIDTSNEKLKVIEGDVMKSDLLSQLMVGHDCVLSALGAAPGGPTTVYSEGMKNIVKAMRECGIKRLVTVTADRTHPYSSFLYRKIITPLFLKELYTDMLRMEKYLKLEVMPNEIQWIVVQPYMLTNATSSKKKCQVGTRDSAETYLWNCNFETPRADLAAFMLSLSRDNESYVGKFVQLGQVKSSVRKNIPREAPKDLPE